MIQWKWINSPQQLVLMLPVVQEFYFRIDSVCSSKLHNRTTHMVWCSPSKLYPIKLSFFWKACHQQPNLQSITLLFHLSHTQITVAHNCLCQHCQYKAFYRKRSLIFVSAHVISGTTVVVSHSTLWRRPHVLCQDNLLNTTMWSNVVKLPDLD